MKNIFKIMFVFIAVGALFVACDKITYFEDNSNAPDANATYYLQFINASKTAETGVTEAGGLVEVTSSIAVVLMGTPQAQDITVNLVLDPSSTFTSNMYTLSANSITIPAGKTSGAVTFSTKAANMPVGQTKKFVLNMDAGAHNNPNTKAIQLTYNIKRIEFCPLTNGVASLVGSWSGTDGQGDYTYTSQVKTVVSGTKLAVSGMSVGFINDFWGESIIAGGTFNMTVAGNGLVDIPRQYIYTTTYAGAPYQYEIKGSGKWTNCGVKPTLLINYDIYYPGDVKGLAATYASYLGGVTYLTANLTLSGSTKSAVMNGTTTLRKVVKK